MLFGKHELWRPTIGIRCASLIESRRVYRESGRLIPDVGMVGDGFSSENMIGTNGPSQEARRVKINGVWYERVIHIPSRPP